MPARQEQPRTTERMEVDKPAQPSTSKPSTSRDSPDGNSRQAEIYRAIMGLQNARLEDTKQGTEGKTTLKCLNFQNT